MYKFQVYDPHGQERKGTMRTLVSFVIVFIFVLGATFTQAQDSPRVGFRAGLGTDVNLGIAYGGGANYLLTFPNNPNNSLELGIIFFGGSFDETTEEFHTYEETTDLFVFGAMANYLIGYNSDQPSTFFVTGVGLANISVEWEERSSTDESLGTPLPGGGSMQADDGSAAGAVFNLGIGKSFKGGIDIRLEIPTIFVFSVPGEASSVVPTLIATIGMRF
jgi:hypothetical protein